MSNLSPTKVVTGVVRFSYVNLVSPRVPQSGGDPKYSTTLLIPKTDTQTKAAMDAAIEAAKIAGASKWNGSIPPILGIPLYDGDGVRPSDGMPFGDECKGHWVITASCKADRKPQIVDQNMQTIIDRAQIYSGMYGRASINFFPYNAGGKKGIGCGLNNVMKTADGEPLGNQSSAEDDFKGVAPAAAPPAPQQPAYGAPAQYQQQYAPPTQNPAYGAPQPAYGTQQYQQPYPGQPQM